uniref:PLAT domain-containing protein n=1 Tax=Ditylenchus dipsaci TaxID=166011 RepID=A0A915EAR3_9BILA
MELYGDLGETGFIRLYFDENNNAINGKLDEKIDVSFKVESVSIGRIYGARVFFDPTPIGQSLYEGFSVLQEIFQKSQVDLPKTSSQWMINHAVLRESTHTPYRYVLSQARLRRRLADEDPYIKELLTTEMEGISTKISKKKAGKRLESNWILSMAITDGSTLLPVVMLCGAKNTSLQMQNLDPTPTDNIISYQLKSSKVGLLRKIRVSVNKERLNISPNEGQETDDFVGIQKIRVCDTANGDELRFPTADIELTKFSVFEFSAIFPDQPPSAIVIYSIRVITGKSTISGKDFVVRLNLNGEMGDIGPRALMLDPEIILEEKPATQPILFEADSINSFDVEAVSIGEVISAELIIESELKQVILTLFVNENEYL